MSSQVDVVVAGGGPVGLALAALLGNAGLEVVVLESREHATPRDESRAITWMPEGLLLADELGITDQLRARASLRTAHEFRRTPSGPVLLRTSFAALRHRHPYTLNLPQHDTETVLETAARASGQVRVQRGESIISVDQDHAGITATARSRAGVETRWRGKIGVACDGARSSRTGIASQLGITSTFTDYGATSVVADVEFTADPADGAVSWVALDPARPCGGFRFGDRRWRIIYRANEGESRQEATADAMVQARIAHAYPGATVHRHLWASAFRLGQGQSRSYRAGRWALAGDAAHAMGPSAGAGMMVGLLGAWRLATAITTSARRGSDGWDGAVERYEDGQRGASRAVQRTNALIFRNLAVSSPFLGGIRNTALRLLGHVPAISHRLAAHEAMIGLAP